MKARASLLCLGAAALFGASTPAGKALLDGLGPVTLAGLLYLGAALATAPSALRTPWALRTVGRANLLRLLGAVLFGGVVGPVALMVALRDAPSATVALLLNLETPATALLAVWWFREHLDGRAWLANGLIVAAGCLLAAPGGFAVAGPALLVALACLAWGLDNNLTATIDTLTPQQTTFGKGLVAGAVNLGLGLALEGPIGEAGLVAPALGVGALAYGVSIVWYVAGAQQLGATRSQMLFATAPFFGTGLGWLALGEPVLGAQVGAGALLVGAVGLLARERHEHPHRHAPLVHSHEHRHDDGHHDHAHEGIEPGTWHTHEHRHPGRTHVHPHVPDLHHRHDHG